MRRDSIMKLKEARILRKKWLILLSITAKSKEEEQQGNHWVWKTGCFN
jgi:hypothetical protein